MTIWILTKSAIKMFVRNKQALFFSLFSPLMIMVIFGFINFDKASKINIGIVSPNPTAETSAFINRLKSFPAFDVKAGTLEQERRAIENGDLSAVLEIPNDFMPKQQGSFTATKTMTILTNTGQLQQAQTAIGILNQIIDQTELNIFKAPTLFKIQEQSVNSRNLRYIDFLVPGIVALSIMQMSVFSVAFVFADLKEKGILKRLLATPMRPFQFVTANVITRLFVSFLQAAILIAVAVTLFHTTIVGSYLLIALAILIGGIMFLGLGFTISGLASTVESVPAIANLVVLPMLFLGGTFFPTNSLPGWLQSIVKFLPLTPFAHAIREIMTKGATLSALKTDFFWMVGWAVVLFIFANITFSFEEKRT